MKWNVGDEEWYYATKGIQSIKIKDSLEHHCDILHLVIMFALFLSFVYTVPSLPLWGWRELLLSSDSIQTLY